MTVFPLNVAETFAAESTVNAPALAVKFALEAPCATVTDAGTVSCELSLASPIIIALVADEDSVIVQLALALGASDVGVHTMLDRATDAEAGLRVTDAAFDTPLDDAVTSAVTDVLTVEAVAVNAAEEPPPAMLTDGGTLSWLADEESATTILPDVAFESATVQFTVAGVVTVEGVHVTDCSDGGAISVSGVLTVIPLNVAVIFATESTVNDPAFAVKLALEAPVAIVTVDGTVSCALLLASAIAVPLVAAEDRVTVQVDDAPGATVEGVHATDCSDDAPPDVTVTDAPVAVVGISVASRDALIALTIPIGTLPVEGLVDTLIATVAMTPFAMVFEFTPVSRHVVDVEVAWHWIDLLASAAAWPAETEIEATSEEE